MSNLTNITQKIIDDAKEKADKIIKNANNEANEILKNSNDKINEMHNEIIKNANEAALAKQERIIAAAQLDGKKQILSTKQQLISLAFDNATSKMASFDDDRYNLFIKNISKNINGEIIMQERDKTKGTGGGFIAKNGRVELNYSFSALGKEAKDNLEKDVVSILFK